MAKRSGQPYRYGWLTALGGLADVVNPAFIAGLGAVLGALVAVFSLAMSAINFAYFYKRRALFRANGRWRWLERSWPGLIGPETLGPDVHPGFTGLSPLYRALFAAAVVIALAAQLLPGG